MLTQSARTIGRHVRNLVVERGWRPGTDVEDRVALALSRCGWKPSEVEQQHPMLGYRLDFAWPAVAVCLEADGWYHRNLDVIERDRRRDADLRGAGWWTFRVDWTAGDELMMLQVGKISRLVRTMLFDAGSWSAELWSRASVTPPDGHPIPEETP